jgi:hypothetical protein
MHILFGGIVAIFGQLHESLLQVRWQLQTFESLLCLQDFVLFGLFAIVIFLGHHMLELLKSLHDLFLLLDMFLLRVIEAFVDLFERGRDGVGVGWLLRAGLRLW